MIQRIKNKGNVLRDDPHMQEVARGTALAFALKLIGAGLSFSFNVAVARLLGADGAGLYFLALSITAIGSIVGRVGLDNTLLRFIASHAARGEWGEINGVYVLGMRIALLASGFLSVLGVVLAPWLADALYSKPELAEPLRWMSLAILPFAISNLHAESLKGLKRIKDAMLFQGIGLPLVALMLIWPLAGLAGATGVAWAYLIASVIVAILAFWRWRSVTKLYDEEVKKYSFSAIWISCHPLWVTSLMNRGVLQWAPLFLLGIWASSEEAGIYGAASRAALLVSFMLFAINNVIGAKFAELYVKGDMQALGRTARQSALLITLLASPIFLVFIFGSQWVMSIFGSEFILGSKVLAVLTLGQFVSTLAGSVNLILNVTGNEKTIRNITVIASITLVAICVTVIPSAGMLGAAIATALVTAFINLGGAFMVWKKCGIISIPFLGKSL